MSSDRVTLQGSVPAASAAGAVSRPYEQVRTASQARTPSTQTKESVRPTAESVEAVAQRLESYLRSVGRSIEFRVDSGSGRTVISVRDSETGELIRQIPNEEVLQFAEMAEDQTLVLLNEKV